MTKNYTWLEKMELEEHYNLSLYDVSYLELFIRRSLPLTTFDESLKKPSELSGVFVKP